MSQSGKVTPFTERDVSCPACRESTTQRYFRRNTFEPHTIEDDQHVSEYRWLIDSVERVHPPYYFVQYCPKCSYADIAEEFEKVFDSEQATQVLRSFKKASDYQQIVIDMLSGAINYGDIQFDSALYLHLLALHQQYIAPEEARDYYKMARLALRIAWLYREQKGEADSGSGDEHSREGLTEGQLALKVALRPLQEAVGAVARSWPALEEAVGKRGAEIAPELGEDRVDPYAAPANALPRSLHELTKLVHDIDTILGRDVGTGLFVEGAPTGGGASLSDVRRFLAQGRDYWPDLPLDEREATELAIAHFRTALTQDSRLSAHDASVPLTLLVGRLYKRLGRYESGMEMVRLAHKQALEGHREYDAMLQDPKISGARLGQIRIKLNRLDEAVEESTALRDMLVRLMIERDAGKIKAVLQKTAGASVEDIQKTLLANDIAPEVISRLKRAGGPLAAAR